MKYSLYIYLNLITALMVNESTQGMVRLWTGLDPLFSEVGETLYHAFGPSCIKPG